MSMINQVLNDLEKRQATAADGTQLLSGDVRSMPPVRRNFGSLLSHVLVALAVLTAVLAWQKYHVAQTPVAVAPVTSGNPPAAPVASGGTKTAPTEPVVPKPTESAAVATDSKVSAAPVATEAAPTQTRPTEATVMATVTSSSDDTSTGKKMASAPVSISGDGGKKPASQSDAKPAVSAKRSSAESEAGHKTVAAQVQSFKIVSPQQRSDNAYRQGILLLQQGNTREAKSLLKQALDANPANQDARLQLSDVLVDAGRPGEAATLLGDGLALAPGHGELSKALARLQVASGSKADALATLEKGVVHAGDDGEYHAFMAALLQGFDRHADAIQHYLVALRSDPTRTGWLIGIGISLQAENKTADAAEAFQRALDMGNMNPDLTRFAAQRLKQLRP